jgi:hypothetical protein
MSVLGHHYIHTPTDRPPWEPGIYTCTIHMYIYSHVPRYIMQSIVVGGLNNGFANIYPAQHTPHHTTTSKEMSDTPLVYNQSDTIGNWLGAFAKQFCYANTFAHRIREQWRFNSPTPFSVMRVDSACTSKCRSCTQCVHHLANVTLPHPFVGQTWVEILFCPSSWRNTTTKNVSRLDVRPNKPRSLALLVADT